MAGTEAICDGSVVTDILQIYVVLQLPSGVGTGGGGGGGGGGGVAFPNHKVGGGGGGLAPQS